MFMLSTGLQRLSPLFRRSMSTSLPSQPDLRVVAAAGLVGGGFGGLVGLGGGAIMVPMMSSWARMTQHQAVGTSSAAVASVGTSGMLSFGSAGAVDLIAAGSLACTALLTARAGAKMTGWFNAVQMARAFAVFQIVVGPLVPLKGLIVGNKKAADAEVAASETSSSSPPLRRFASFADATTFESAGARTSQLLKLAATGCVAGFASGMFGIGGGVIITPALCVLTDMPYAMVLGTTLASMVPPALVSVYTHHGMGNVVASAVVPLVIGSALGSFASGQVAVRVPEEPLQWVFAIVLFSQGALKLWALRGK